jgi:endonuclease-3 related protein
VKNSPLLTIYRQLLAHHGPQHWWPGDTAFEVMVGAILTQSAAWRNVEKAIANLKAAGAMSPQTLRQLPLPEIAHLVHPSGFYNAKAVKLKSLVDWLGMYCADNIDKLSTIATEELRTQMLSVHGIGQETADSILLYAIGKPVFVIDTYTRRIISHLGLAPDEDNYEAYQVLFMDNLPSDVQLFNEYHALLVYLGKDICRREPLCQQCCLVDICEHRTTD